MAKGSDMLDDGEDPREHDQNSPMKGGTTPGGTILGPKQRWDPGPMPDRAAHSEADTSVGGTVSKKYSTEM